MNKKIKCSVTCWHYPKWYESGHSYGKGQEIELELKDLPSIKTISKKEPPHLNTYLVIEERHLESLFSDLTRTILNKYENVSSIDLNFYSQKIYTPDMSKETGNWRKIYEVSAGENYAKVHKRREFSKYFNRSVFETIGKEKKPFHSEYIGYTGRSKDDLLKGEELRCTVLFHNTDSYKNEHIYIKGISKIEKRWNTGPVSEYFIIPKDFFEQAKLEFYKILRANNNVKAIKVHCKLFDESIRAFDKTTSNNLDFEKNIEYYYTISYDSEAWIELKKELKGKHQTFIESKKTGRSNANYDELERKYGYLDFQDERHLDDWRIDYYSDL